MDKKIVVGIMALSVVLIVGFVFLVGSSSNSQPKVASYQISDKEKPKVEVKNPFGDLGEMKVSDQKTLDFTLKNTGDKPLQLSNVSTSCGCTLAQIIIEGKASPEFGMHSTSNYMTELAPGKEATVRAIYRPYIMPVYGIVEREVYVQTNDPANPKLVFKVRANVQ